MEHSLDRVLLVPRNGYINRLQAWASATILSETLGVPLSVSWAPQPAAPATATNLFAASVVTEDFVDPVMVEELTGVPHASLPRYLTVLPEQRVVVLAGHDRGEQTFMPELLDALADASRPRTLLIIAGGKFHLPAMADFALKRARFYSGVRWSDPIEQQTHEALEERGPFIAAHIRQTDRSREAPTARALEQGVLDVAQRTGLQDLFVTADTASARQEWIARTQRLGLRPWTVDHTETDRSTAAGAVAAMVDWRILCASAGLVYTASSSFGEEASIGGETTQTSQPLSASPLRQRSRALGERARSAASYPTRHGWFGNRT